MEMEKIVKFFLDNEIQISPDVIDFIQANETNIEDIVKLVAEKKLKGKIIDKKILEEMLQPQTSALKVVSKPVIKSQFITTEAYTQYFLEKYEVIKKIFMEKEDVSGLISVNKVGQKSKSFSLIAMIADRLAKDDTIMVEDQTGRVAVNISRVDSLVRDRIIQDEIVMVKCEQENGNIYANQILFPDIPLRKDVNRTKSKSLLLMVSDIPLQNISKLRDNVKGILDKMDYEKLYILLSANEADLVGERKELEQISDKVILHTISQNNIPFFSMVCVEGAVNVYIVNGQLMKKYFAFWKESTENILRNLLQKRDINPVFEFDMKIYEKNPFVLEKIPDLILSTSFGNAGILNYKGATITTNGNFPEQPIYWIINLHTRETIKIELS